MFSQSQLTRHPLQMPFRSYLYAADLAVWLWTILFKGESSHPYNLGSDQEITIGDLANIVSSLLGGSVYLPSISTSNFNCRLSRYLPSVRSAQTELDLKIWLPLNDAIGRTAA